MATLLHRVIALFACAAAVATASASAAAAPVTDSKGLVFEDADAFCRYHCKPTHILQARRQLAESECTVARCDAFLTANDVPHTRRLQGMHVRVHVRSLDEKRVHQINFVTCKSVSRAPQTVSLRLDDSADSSVFRGFHEAFFGAFESMIASTNATYDACQLQFLQEDFLPTANQTQYVSTVERKPMLVKLHTTCQDQFTCVRQVKEIWSDEDESMTPLISRQDENGHGATIMLVHVSKDIAEKINELDCIESVTELPPILKLMPFARSAYQLSMSPTTTAPALEIRLVRGADQNAAFKRLQNRIQEMSGIQNVVELPNLPDQFPRQFFTKSLDELETWSKVVGVLLSDPEIEWVDEKFEIVNHSFRVEPMPASLEMEVDAHAHVHRRLDDYAPSLVGVDPARKMGIRGNDIIVGMTDSGLYMDHDQFDQDSRAIFGGKSDKTARKVIQYYDWADKYDESEDVECGHGTHVGGILAGSSFSGKSSNFGIADNAKIAFMDIGQQDSACQGLKGCQVRLATPGDASDLLKTQMSVGARVFSFSWGTPGTDYSAQARDLDAFIYDNPDVLIVVAAGNSGENTARGQSTISSPSGAKNVISVGASLNSAQSFADTLPCPNIFNQYSVASFSSAGPTTDGRMKPDVVAPGMMLVSARSEKPGSTTKTSQTCKLQGTSQATPVVTGIAVLLYEWLRDGWWKNGVKDAQFAMKKIPAALLKALIIHSGEVLSKRIAPMPTGPVSCAGIESTAWGLTYPDMYQGYGKPNMSNIADFSSGPDGAQSLYFLPNSTDGSEPRVAHQKEVRISFTVPKGVDLRATLVWTDKAGALRSGSQLQHDLDLTVTIRNGTKTFYPLTADNTTKRDDKNNVEMVQVSYKELLDAVNSEPNGKDLLGPGGEIVVEAVIFGRSVLLETSQSFAFVASSSVIGTAMGIVKDDKSSSFWKPWTIGAVAAGAFVAILILMLCCRCCSSRSRRRHGPPPQPAGGFPGYAAPMPGAPVGVPHHQRRQNGSANQYLQHQTPGAAVAVPRGQGGLERCPFCNFASADAVLMVNHVEMMHETLNGTASQTSSIPQIEDNFGLPVMPMVTAAPSSQYSSQNSGQHMQVPPPAPSPAPQPRPHGGPGPMAGAERCPFCNFSTDNAVILVNHVEHIHGQ